MSEARNAGTSTASPTTVVCARCGGAIEPGLERCPTCGTAQSCPDARGGSGLGLAGHLAGLLGAFMILAWMWPDVLRHVGLARIADWLEASGGRHRWMLMPLGFMLMGISGIRTRPAGTSRPGTPPPSASEPGGRVAIAPHTVEPEARQPGTAVRARAQRWLLALDTPRQRSNESTRLRCAVVTRRDLHFALMPQNRMIKAMTSPRIGGFLLGLGRASSTSGGPQNQARQRALDEMSFLVGEPVELGEPEFDHAFLLKSDDPAAARALFGGLRGVVLALRRPASWWQISLTASVAGGIGMLEFLESGVVRDAARLEAAQQAMIRILESLLAGGFIAEGSPSSNT